MGGRLLEGPTMVGGTSDWKDELGRFLKPFLDRLGHKARRQMCPLYVSGLIGPGDRKSIQPMPEQLALREYDQLHHFISAGVWDATPWTSKRARSKRAGVPAKYRTAWRRSIVPSRRVCALAACWRMPVMG